MVFADLIVCSYVERWPAEKEDFFRESFVDFDAKTLLEGLSSSCIAQPWDK